MCFFSCFGVPLRAPPPVVSPLWEMSADELDRKRTIEFLVAVTHDSEIGTEDWLDAVDKAIENEGPAVTTTVANRCTTKTKFTCVFLDVGAPVEQQVVYRTQCRKGANNMGFVNTGTTGEMCAPANSTILLHRTLENFSLGSLQQAFECAAGTSAEKDTVEGQIDAFVFTVNDEVNVEEVNVEEVNVEENDKATVNDE